MDTNNMLEFARGPLFITTFLFMLLGLGRLFVLNALAAGRVVIDAGDRGPDPAKMAGTLAEWIVPLKHLFRVRPLYSIVSFVWHICLIATPLFFVGHMLLWSRGTGIDFLAQVSINRHIADVLVAIMLASTAVLFVLRLVQPETRTLSSASDYFLLLLLAVPFITGFLAAHPSVNPIAYPSTMLLHVLSAELIFVLVPLTKLSHAVLFPFNRVSEHIYWTIPEGSGRLVAKSLRGDDASV